MHATTFLLAASIFLVVLTSCSGSAPPTWNSTSSASNNGQPPDPVNKEWKFQAASIHAEGPFNLTLQVSGAAENAPFHWSVTVTNSRGSSLFQVEHDDQWMDKNFGDEGYMGECQGHRACKSKWYFEELPEIVGKAIKIVDSSAYPKPTAIMFWRRWRENS